jgi:hypothetical protein
VRSDRRHAGLLPSVLLDLHSIRPGVRGESFAAVVETRGGRASCRGVTLVLEALRPAEVAFAVSDRCVPPDMT